MDALVHGVVEQVRFFGSNSVHDFEGEVHVATLVAEDPVGAVGKAVEQALGAQEVHVGERCEEEQAFDAGCEADQVHQELTTFVLGVQLADTVEAAHVLEAEVSLLLDRRNVLDRSECCLAFVHVGDVVVEQCEVELHMQRFFVELA